MKTKLSKYLDTVADKVAESKSGRSSYYQIGNKILRLSDHIGKSSSGYFQIIERPNGYLLYHPATGTIHICEYREIQEFVRAFKLFPVELRTEPQVIVAPKPNEDTVLGIPFSALSSGQQHAITDIIDKVKKII